VSTLEPAAEAMSGKAAAIVADIRSQQARDPRVTVLRRDAMAMIGVGESRLLELERDGKLRSFLDVGVRRITSTSIYDYLVERAVAAHPAGADELKRTPQNIWRAVRAKAGKPPLSPARKAALDAENARRHAEAEARKAAKRGGEQKETGFSTGA
jgi:hypothetical protein